MENLVQDRVSGKKLGEVRVAFSGKNLTGFGGLAAFAEFVKRLRLIELLETVEIGHVGRLYSRGRLMASLLLGFVVGLDRISDVARLGRDEVLLRILGWASWPVQSTISRFLWRFVDPAVHSLQKVFAAALERFRNGWKGYERLHLDFDSHVRTVYGTTLEEAAVGYNPNKHGRRSYHPLMAFIGETKDILRGRFRAGNVRSANGVVEFLNESLCQLGWERLKWLIVRADSGFCETPFLQALESYGDRLKYVIALRFLPKFQCLFVAAKYQPLPGSDSIEVASFESKQWPDGKARRIVVIREAVPEREKRKVAGKQLKLFPEMKKYVYRAFVTNSKAEAADVWRDYNGRATCENVIKEAIRLGLDVNATRKFHANAAHFLLTLLACNLLNWFKEVAIGVEEVKRMPKWVRSRLLCVPARLVTSGRQLVLKFSKNWAWRELLERACLRTQAWSYSGCT